MLLVFRVNIFQKWFSKRLAACLLACSARRLGAELMPVIIDHSESVSASDHHWHWHWHDDQLGHWHRDGTHWQARPGLGRARGSLRLALTLPVA